MTGALAFQHLGFVATVPVALLLVVMAGLPLLDDIAAALQKPR